MSQPAKTPRNALTIAGSDSGGGAGIQADLKSFSARGVFGASVVTAITAQNTQAVTAVHPVPVDVVAAQIEAVLSDIDIAAIKIGMLFSPELIDVVTDGLASFTGTVILDPVMIAKSGDALLQDAAVSALVSRLLPRADLITPNLPEAARLAGQDDVTNDTAQRLMDLGAQAVLVKGGHGDEQTCVDMLHLAGDVHRFEAPRLDTRNTHGTGCSYSSAIAAECAKGLAMPDAVAAAHGWLHGAIRAADQLNVGQGHGPVHHFHELWG